MRLVPVRWHYSSFPKIKHCIPYIRIDIYHLKRRHKMISGKMQLTYHKETVTTKIASDNFEEYLSGSLFLLRINILKYTLKMLIRQNAFTLTWKPHYRHSTKW